MSWFGHVLLRKGEDKEVGRKFPLIGEYLRVISNDTKEVLEYIKEIKFEDLSESDKKLFTNE